jgi:glucose/mannose-6-phosphate isomerase
MTSPPDSLGLFDAARRVPEQTEAALLAAQDAALPDAGTVASVVLIGAGAAAWAAEAVAAVAAPVAPVPFVVPAEGTVPAFVSSSTLALAVSLHGGERDVVDAAEAAAAAGATVVAVTGGGDLGRWAHERGVASVPLDASVPHARAALGALVAAPFAVLDRFGLIPGGEAELDAAVAQLHRRRAKLPPGENPATRLARRIGRTLLLVYGEGPIGAVAARRWKQQCNLNAKIPAFAASLPEIAHDEIVGWGQHGDLTRQVFSAVVLRHAFGAVGGPERFAALDEVLVEAVGAVHEVDAEGGGRLAQLLDLAYVGDLVSLHLAAQEGLDPGPAPALDLLRP